MVGMVQGQCRNGGYGAGMVVMVEEWWVECRYSTDTAGTVCTVQIWQVWCRGYGTDIWWLWHRYGRYGAGMVGTHNAHSVPVGTFTDLPCIVDHATASSWHSAWFEAHQRRMHVGAVAEPCLASAAHPYAASISLIHPQPTSPSPMGSTGTKPNR